MNSIKNFSVIYEGDNYLNGEMDVKSFAPSLIAFGQLLEMANRALNEDKSSIQVSIKSNFENKCFKCNLALYGNKLLDNIPLVANAVDIVDIDRMLKIIGFVDNSSTLSNITSGFIVSYICYKIWEKGRKVESYVELEDGKGYKIKIAGEEKFVEKTLFKLIEKTWTNQKITPFFKTLQEHLKPSGYKKYKKDGEEKTLNCDELNNLLSQEEDFNIQRKNDYQEIKTNLKIRTPDLEGDRKWEFVYIGSTIKPSYSDSIKESLIKLRNEDFNLKYCLIPVKLRIDFIVDKNGEKIKNSEKYTIIEITGEIKKPISNNQENLSL